jgi:hypothetical protein
MNNYSMTCSCGHTMTVDAGTRDEAIRKMQGMMTPEAVAKHMAEKHPGQPVLQVSQVHAMIAQNIQAA